MPEQTIWTQLAGNADAGIAFVVVVTLLGFFVKKMFKLIDEREVFQKEIILKQQENAIECQNIIKQNQELLLANHEVIRESTHVMSNLADKYDDLKEVVNIGFTDLKDEINEVYKVCLKDKEC